LVRQTRRVSTGNYEVVWQVRAPAVPIFRCGSCEYQKPDSFFSLQQRTMATPWECIEEDYRAFLQAAGYNADDFNETSFQRAGTYIAFHQFQQQQAHTEVRN
jgi:hypothetical protein